MTFQLSSEQKELQDAARSFAQRELPALAKELEATASPVPHHWLRRYAEMGFLSVNTPIEFGGLGLGALEALLVVEEFAKISVAVAFPVFECCTGPVRIIERFGNPQLKQRIVTAAARGEMLVAISMSEPEAGTALTDLRATGRFDNGSIVLNGTKRWCSGAGHSGGYVVFCRLDDSVGGRGIGAVFVEKGTHGLSFGPEEELMGFRGVPSADIFLDEVRVPAENLLVPAGRFGDLMSVFNLERCGNAAMSLGVAGGAFEQALSYVQERQQFGRALVDFQAVQLRLAEIAIKVEASRLLVYRAGAGAEEGLPLLLDASLAKCAANETVREVTASAMQLMGGYGYARQYGAEQRFRDAWGWGVAGGTIDIQKINIASSLVGRRFDQRR